MTHDEPGPRRGWLAAWPWLLLAALIFPAVWHDLDFPDDIDDEYPSVQRPTFSPHPPPAYRLAEPGDTIDRIGIYVSSVTIVLALGGLTLTKRSRAPWAAALATGAAAFWFVANPGPTFDGWHGLGWRTTLDPVAPWAVRVCLIVFASGLLLVVATGLARTPGGLGSLWSVARERRMAWPLAVAAVFVASRIIGFPDPEPHGYWPRWAFVWGLALFAAALLRSLPDAGTRRIAAGRFLAAALFWYALVVVGIDLTWYHRPLDRLREIVPGRIYMSAMPTGRGLEIAQQRHHFKTIVNLFPEDTPQRSPRLPEELRFARAHGVRYVGSPPDAASSNAFLDLTLELAQDPDAWPILVHCHGCMDRTPAWVGIYRFVVEGRPLDATLRFIEQHRGYRPKASVTLLYNRVLPRLAPEAVRTDPTFALLQKCVGDSLEVDAPTLEDDRSCVAGVEYSTPRSLEAEEDRGMPHRTPDISKHTAPIFARPGPSLTPRR